jgi:uncharacterized membrane protein
MLLCILALVTASKRPTWTAPLRTTLGWFVLAGILDGSDLLLQFASHKFIDVVITITLKRAGVILSVLCGWLIFREKEIGDRLLGSTVMLAGVLIIYLPLNMRECAIIAVPTVATGLVLISRATGNRSTLEAAKSP